MSDLDKIKEILKKYMDGIYTDREAFHLIWSIIYTNQ